MNLEERRKGIGGSDAAAVAGISKWKTPLDVYLEKIGKSKEQEESDAMHFGKVLEPIVASEYEQRTGKVCLIEPALLQHPKYPWMLANIDRRIANENAILECKTANAFAKKDWGEEESDQMPDEYLMQCAHYAAVCNVNYVDIAVLIGGQKFQIYKYERNKQLEERLIDIEHDFWRKHVLAQNPPTPRSYEEAIKIFGKADESKSVIATEEIEEAFNALVETKAVIKTMKQKEEFYKTKISAFMKDSALLHSASGQLLATWKNQITNRIDATLLKKTKPTIYKEFTKTTESRVLKIKEAA